MIRRITEREAWRLMGFTDEDYSRAEATGISRNQLYKQAGNSIVVNVLEAIFRQMLPEKDRNHEAIRRDPDSHGPAA